MTEAAGEAGRARPGSHEHLTPIDMDEKLDDQVTFPDGGTRAWLVAFGNAGVMFCTLGYVNSWGVYQAYYESHQLSDKSSSAISWIGSLQVFFVFAGGLVGGPLFDRYGAKIIRPAILVYVFAIMMTSLCKEYWQFMLAQGLLGGIANGMTMSPAMASTPQYFDKKRGAAMGIAIAGSSLGGVVLPIVMGKMLYSSLGFGWSVRVIGFIFLAVLGFSGAVIRARLPPRDSRYLLPSAFKEPLYDTLIVATFFMVLGLFIPIFFLPTYAESYGMSSHLASYLVAILNAASLPGRVLPGILSDKFGRLNMLAAAGVSSGILIFCWQKVTTNASIIVFAALFGFCSGAIVSGVSVGFASCPRSPQDIGTYMGMGLSIGAVAALIGPPINGALVNHYHGFEQVSYFSGALTLFGSFVAFFAKAATPEGLFAKV
ncbi:putative monocarboxylate permease-like protein [Phaeomoniella chlamydospora]|uniref:Putative monocarboxylate permease-like protein n=1 Tax=Phaeomoniella chlamydospora TaxID=158046 RepID=A0A0G2ETM5_PHACM|nr:putative monocarboxylate permease-like protein [Phaeomoniella chlamydospora]